MTSWIETLWSGVMLGALYALFALGLSLSLGVMRMINLAHGDLIVLGAYLASVVVQTLGWPPLLSLLVVVPVMFALGAALQWGLLNRMAGRPALSPMLLTFGLSVVLQNVLQEVFSADTRSLPSGDLGLRSLSIGDLSVGVLPLVTALLAVAVFAVTDRIMAGTHFGRQVRAVADDPAVARLVGVHDRRLFALMAAVILAISALASVLYGMRTPFSPSAGPERLLYAFEAVVLGGLGHLWGTLAGGLAIGLVQVLGARLDSGLGPLFAHLFFLVVLVARPQGLFSRGART